MPSLAHTYGMLESLPRVPVTPSKFAESVVTPTPGTFQIPGVTMSGLPVLGQLNIVSAIQTVPTVQPNLRTVPQAMDSNMSNVAGSSAVAPDLNSRLHST